MNRPVKQIFSKDFLQAYLMIYQLEGSDKHNHITIKQLEEKGVRRSYGVRIAEALLKKNLVGSVEGRTGGYYLKTDPTSALTELFGRTRVSHALRALELISGGL